MAVRPGWFTGVVVVLLMVAFGCGTCCVTAAEAPALPASLGLVPESAAFYGSSLRNAEQWQVVAKSQAWAKIKALPVVQMGTGLYMMQTMDPQSVPGQIERARKDPEIRKLIDLAVDLASKEIFFFGDQDCIDFLQLCQQLMGVTRSGKVVAQAKDEPEKNPSELQGMMAISILAENTARLKAPGMMVGFQVTNKALAQTQLDRLEKELGRLVEKQPLLKGRLKKSKVAGNDYLTLNLDGSMIPWNEVPLEEAKKREAKPGDVDKVVARVKELTFVIAIGIRDDYLLVSLGPSTDAIKRLGTGPTLGGRKELQPAKKYADKRLTGLSYMSKAIMGQLAGTKHDIDSLRENLEQLLPLTGLTESQMDEIRADGKTIAEDLKTIVPEQGAAMSVSFMTDTGMEAYGFDWSEHRDTDASKPLSLLQHIGGSPFLAVVGRSKVSLKEYDLLVKWLGLGKKYVDKYAVPQMKPKERTEYEAFVVRVTPLVKRLDTTNRTMLFPALADGQTALILDTKLMSKQFIKALPATEKPMPMLEPALVFGVSDAALLKKAFVEYFAIADGVLDAIRAIPDTNIPPDFKIPAPKKIKSDLGAIYAYRLPKEWGVTRTIQPNAGLSEKVAVLSLSKEHTERLLAETPAEFAGRPPAADRKLAAAVVFDFAGLMDAVTPWVDFAVQKATTDESGQPSPQRDYISEQVHTVLDVLKVFRNITAESYLEDGVHVLHMQSEFHDVK